MPRGEWDKLTHGLRPRRLMLRAEAILGEPIHIHHALKARRGLFIRWVIMSLSVGVATGALVALIDFLIRSMAAPFLYGLKNPWAYLLLPPSGLVLAALIVKYLVPGTEGSLTEAYIVVYHNAKKHTRLANLPGKIAASLLTLAFGGSMGLEGPAIYTGASLGDALQMKMQKLFRREDLKLLLVAGAAAGMSAVFKAPLTGIIFAMEVPFVDSLAARALVPAMLASSASYLTFVLFVGAKPIFSRPEVFHLGPSAVGMSLLLGLCCGLGARLFVWFTNLMNCQLKRLPEVSRAAIAGLGVGSLGAISFLVFGEPYVLGPGYKLIKHLLSGHEPLSLILLLLGAKIAATAFTTAGGGVGGLFFPMAVMGTIMGSGFEHFMPGQHGAVYPIIGLAAFIAAGYRTPLAAVAFVAETTGNPWTLIPAMLASVVSFLVMGRHSISDEQRNMSGSFFGLPPPR